MKEQYITITGIKHYYGIIPFEIGRKVTCVKEPDNYYDQEAIRCQVKHIGTVGYVANSTYTVAVGTKSAGRIAHKVKKKFKVQVMFVAGNYVICKVVDLHMILSGIMKLHGNLEIMEQWKLLSRL